MTRAAHFGPSIRIKGDVTAQEPLTIEGQVFGTIDVRGHALTVADAACINATVIAHSIVVGGSVNGRLSAEGRIVVQPSATVEGDVSAQTVFIQEGARVQGHFEIAGTRKPV
jgi:cytoskeletal protein CcmA (bactofilin family)